jgi:uncharacterized protein
MKFLVLLFFCVCCSVLKAQKTADENLNDIIVSNFHEGYKPSPKRKILSIREKSFISKLNPLIYLSAGLLYVYQNTLSEQIQAECGYEISCSSYTKYQMEKNGFRGFLLGFHQLNNCTPWAVHDYASYKVNKDGKIINPVTSIKND